ncbi:MAG: MBL fold metallo-hydrolase [Candidatus Hermodarchaeota archaeon]
MVQELITVDSGKVNDYLHHIDARAYGQPRRLSVYLAEFDDCSILFDSGSSLEVKKLIRYFKKEQIRLDSFKYLVPSHHHFDHAGGMHLLYNILKKYSPDIRILTNQKTKELLNNYEPHLNRARRTYSNLVGTMSPIDDDAFEIIEPSTKFFSDPNKLEIIHNFLKNGEELKLCILKTPGHVPDHQTPLFIKDSEIDFIYFGEATGTIYNTSKLLTMPVSMPIFYNHTEYMQTLNNLKKITPLKAGFGHFGVINGKENVREVLLEHEEFIKFFKECIIKYYNEKPETKYVLSKVLPLLTSRTDLPFEYNSIFNGVALGIVYGMMISLGFRSIPEEDKEFFKQYS